MYMVFIPLDLILNRMKPFCRILFSNRQVVAFVTALTVVLTVASAQAQNVTEKFEKLSVSENFDSVGTWWTVVSNAENLFIIQDGEYILQRKAISAPFAILASLEEDPAEFRAVVSLKLEKTMGDAAHIGILFMMQPQGQGGFLFEINKKKEYRLRQIAGGAYRYISGSTKDQGWTKHQAVNEAGSPNILEVRTSKGAYDLYINNAYIRSFSEPNYRSGKVGLIVGPDTRGRADYFYIFRKGNITAPEPEPADPNNTAANSPDLIELAQSIISLKTRINELEEENTGLKRTISAINTGEQEKDVQIRNTEKQIVSLQDQITKKEATIDSLTKANAALRPYKDMIGNKDGDVIINLSKALKTEKEKNQKLEEELRLIREKQGEGKSPSPKSSGKQPAGSTTGTTKNDGTAPVQDTKKDPNVFSLPR